MPVTAAPYRRTTPSLHQRLRSVLAPPTIVLAYHRVVPVVANDINRLQVSTRHFADQIEWLARHAHSLSTEQFVRLVPTRTRPTLALDALPRVLVTFDDGYADNVEHALPILARHDMDAIIFVTTSHASSGAPYWWDALEQAVVRDDDRASLDLYAALHAELKPLDAQTRRERLTQLGASPTAEPSCRPARWDELDRWRAAGLAIGAHTQTHPMLVACSDAAIEDEIAGARSEIATQLRVAPTTIAYPYGTRGDFDTRAEQAARAAGFACGFANWPGNVRWARNPFALPRHLVRDWNLAQFTERFMTWCDL